MDEDQAMEEAIRQQNERRQGQYNILEGPVETSVFPQHTLYSAPRGPPEIFTSSVFIRSLANLLAAT